MQKERMMRSLFTAVVVVVIFLVCLLQAAFGAAVTSSSSLSDSWNLGDQCGGYWTSSSLVSNAGQAPFIWTQLGSNIYGTHKVESANAWFEPYYYSILDPATGQYTKTQHGYKVTEVISGNLSAALTAADMGTTNQQNDLSARGMEVHEFSATSGYREMGTIKNQGDCNVALKNFAPTSSYGQYNEYTGSSGSYFNYQVCWYGDFTSPSLTMSDPVSELEQQIKNLQGQLNTGISAGGGSSSAAAVPEPGSAILALVGAICVGFSRYFGLAIRWLAVRK